MGRKGRKATEEIQSRKEQERTKRIKRYLQGRKGIRECKVEIRGQEWNSEGEHR